VKTAEPDAARKGAGCTLGTPVSSLSSAGVPGAAAKHTVVRSADRSGVQIGQREEVRQWVKNQPDTAEEPRRRFRLTAV
jgi:hypothetical protein